MFEAESPHLYARGSRLRQLTSRGDTPAFVFLDASGKKVAETAGFRNPREAKALHGFVSKRRYLKTTWQEYSKQ